MTQGADWGVKTYRGKRADGTAWEKTKSWFGYKLHLLVDSVHELPLAFMVTKASEDDMTNIVPLVEDLEKNHEELADGAEEVAADKGYDSAGNNTSLYDDHGIIPVIDNRHLWKEDEGKPRPLFPEHADVFFYDEDGKVYCQCPSEQKGAAEVREMAFVGFEKERGTLKYRCPDANKGDGSGVLRDGQQGAGTRLQGDQCGSMPRWALPHAAVPAGLR